ncbi:MAG: dephospho-CoA kinase [Longimicrobiales bacterium]
MMTVAVTGNVASGKSLLCRIWAEEGVPVIHADDLSRDAVEPGTPGLAAVVAEFGAGILDPEGRLDRDALREVVFQDQDARRRLEEILHPVIGARRDRWMRARRKEGCLLAVAEIPLLYEVGLQGGYDAVVLVHAPPEERLRRLKEDRKMEEEEARSIMEAQMPAEEKLDRADYVVRNDGSRTDLEIRALALLDLLRARARGVREKGIR